MPFNQLQTLPCELQLHQTPDGPRLRRMPIKELESLRQRVVKHSADGRMVEGQPWSLASLPGGLLEVHADIQPAPDSDVILRVNGVEIRYDAAKQEIAVAGLHASAPLQDGHQRITVFADRTYFTIFASDGLTYIPVPIIAKPEDHVELQVKGGPATVQNFEAYELKSIWEAPH
jgi:hypothetical protein